MGIRREHAEMFIQESMVEAPFPVDKLLPPVAQGFDCFLDEPKEYKKKCGFNEYNNGDPDLGYVKRDDEEQKEFFHYKKHLCGWLDDAGVRYEHHREWLVACDRLLWGCVKLQQELAQALDQVLPRYHFYKMLTHSDAARLQTLRALAYRDAYAEGHQDKNFVTGVVAQSKGRSPLWLGEERKQYYPKPDRVLLFAGKKAAYHTGGMYNPRTDMFEGGIIRAMEHGVKEEPDEKFGGEQRKSFVVFGHGIPILPGEN